MILLVLCVCWLVVVGVLLGRAVRQFARYETIDASGPPMTGQPTIEVIVPARNESQNIARCIEALRAQEVGPDQVRITIVDDGSTDGTAQAAHAAAAGDERVNVVASANRPDGWAGKSWACWSAASRSDAQWLCFIDADTFAEPALLRAAVATAQARHLDMLSLEPRQLLVSPAERLVIPTGLLFMAFCHDIGKVNDPGSSVATANGQFILIRRGVYQRVGGHRAVRSSICEDAALARRVKHRGNRLALMGAESLMQTRMYRGLRPLWEGLSKNATEMAGGPGRTLVVAFLGLALGWLALVLPLLSLAMAIAQPGPVSIGAAVAAAAALLTLLGMHIGGAVRLRIPVWYGLLFPVGYTLTAAVAINSARLRWRGEVMWKGRRYDVVRHEAAPFTAAPAVEQPCST